MYDATVGASRKADVNKIVNEMWIAFQLDIDFEDILKIWNIILDSNGIYRPYLEGWDQESQMPYFKTISQGFEYENELHFHDDSTYYVFSESLNDKTPDSEWKQKVRNWFAWNSISQS